MLVLLVIEGPSSGSAPPSSNNNNSNNSSSSSSYSLAVGLGVGLGIAAVALITAAVLAWFYHTKKTKESTISANGSASHHDDHLERPKRDLSEVLPQSEEAPPGPAHKQHREPTVV